MSDLTASQITIAFTFARSEAAPVRLANGVMATAAVNVPRFDHDPDGNPRGLLVTPGVVVGGHDRLAFDELMLPEALTEGTVQAARAATVYHEFRPLSATEISRADFEAGIIRRAYYTRESVVMIDALMKLAGHHLVIGVHAGFAPNRGGQAFYRGKLWQLPALIAANDGVLAAAPGQPLITSGAELLS